MHTTLFPGAIDYFSLHTFNIIPYSSDARRFFSVPKKHVDAIHIGKSCNILDTFEFSIKVLMI